MARVLDARPDVTETFCRKNGVSLIVRSHQFVRQGYKVTRAGSLSLSLSLCLCVSLCGSLEMCLSLCVSVCLYASLYVSLSLPASLSLSLCPSLSAIYGERALAPASPRGGRGGR
jgi:hypothetical protein